MYRRQALLVIASVAICSCAAERLTSSQTSNPRPAADYFIGHDWMLNSGSGDDDAAAQAWANSVSNDCSDSVSAMISAGSFTLNNEIVINNDCQSNAGRHIYIHGAGSTQTILIQNGTSTDAVLFPQHPTVPDAGIRVWHQDNVYISGISVVSGNPSMPDYDVRAGAGVRFDFANGGGVQQSTFVGMSTAGVDNYYSTNITVVSDSIACSTTSGSSMGVALRATNSSTVSGNQIFNCNDEGLFLEGANNNTVTNNSVTCTSGNTCGEGASVIGHINEDCTTYLTSNSNNVSSNTFSSPGTGSGLLEGISVYGDGPAQYNTFYNNTIAGGRQHGIVVGGTWTYSTAARNACHVSLNDWGAAVAGHGYNTISANTITDVNNTGIWLGSSGNNLPNNTIIHARENGLMIDIPTSGNSATGNQINGSQYNGIYAGGFNQTISDNNLTWNWRWGLCSDSRNSSGYTNYYTSNAWGTAKFKASPDPAGC